MQNAYFISGTGRMPLHAGSRDRVAGDRQRRSRWNVLPPDGVAGTDENQGLDDLWRWLRYLSGH